ncbi:nuclear factor 7, brain-like [Pholidichthys leucotaenia]
MAAASSLLSKEHFLCAICLDVFTDPVTLSCGYNFCKICIQQHWDANNQSQCPVCKKVFDARPELHVNTFISEMSAQFRQLAVVESSSSSEQKLATPGDVQCDVCTGVKLRALKSCLECLTSYCDGHLELHEKITGKTRHLLTDPMEKLEDRMCKSHSKALEMFCQTDEVCVCLVCIESDHKTHLIVPLIEKYEEKKDELEKKSADIQQMIQERQQKIEELRESVVVSRKDTNTQKVASVEVFTALIQSIERDLTQLTDMIEEKQKEREERVESFITELEEEISELMKRSSELEQLSDIEDHLSFLQRFQSMNPDPPTEDWTEVKVHSSYERTLRTAVAQLEEMLNKELKKVTEAELKTVQQFVVEVNLDPDTANPNLNLSNNGKNVSHRNERMNLPDNPKRFSTVLCVLSKECFTSGKFYCEIQVKEKKRWTLGVARESINRKGTVTLGPRNGNWSISLRNGDNYRAHDEKIVPLCLEPQPGKVGVFVDYEEGVVSFYDVDTETHIYSFTGCDFTERLYLFLNPGHNDNWTNSAPLIITEVTH